MVVFDANFLAFLLQEDHPPIEHPRTKEKMGDMKRRIQHLLVGLQETKTKILIPTPALTEILTIFADKTGEIIRELEQSYGFEIVPFDTKSAIEAGMFFYSARKQGDKRGGSQRAWQRVKFDRQIVSIAKAHGATGVYSTDGEVLEMARQLNMEGIDIWDLRDPPPEQEDLNLEPRDKEEDGATDKS